MKHPVKADIYDELVKHLKAAVALHLGSRSRKFQPTIVSLMEVAVA